MKKSTRKAPDGARAVRLDAPEVQTRIPAPRDWKMRLQADLKNLPDAPGVYQYFDASGEILYVGKARLLKRRVQSYFGRDDLAPRTAKMVSHIRRMEWTVTASEAEALILEANLIKSLSPRWNILFRDDKTYPYIKLNLQHTYPWVEKTRRVVQDGGLYFGPFTNGTHVFRVLQFMDRAYQLIKCNTDVTRPGVKICLEHQIGRCNAPCEKVIDQAQYQREVLEVRQILEGQTGLAKRRLEGLMREAAENWEFEKAGDYRDQIRALEVLKENQNAEGAFEKNEDYFALESTGRFWLIQHLLVREGRIVQQLKTMGELEELKPWEVLSECIRQRLLGISDPPAAILIADEALPEEEREVLQEAFKARFGRQIPFETPRQGRRRRLLEMTLTNATEGLRVELQKSEDAGRLLEDIRDSLGLSVIPYRIDCFDISNIQGTDAVASMVVCLNGRMESREYRRFKIRCKDTPDDFAMMHEAISRRYGRLLREGSKLPDLILVDGGIGQLRAARAALEEIGIGEHPLCSLAKREELIHVSPREDLPVQLGSRSSVRLLFQQIRDEAHRFAITYHKLLRSKRTLHSELEDIPGIGPKTRQKILKLCPSLARLKEMSLEEIRDLGLSEKVARSLRDYFDRIQV